MRRLAALTLIATTVVATTIHLPAAPAAAARPVVYLTFDDGPSDYTPKVLDVLARYGVKATFFQVGRYVGGRRSITQRVVASGHKLGNHTWGHPTLTSLSSAGIRTEVSRTQAAFASAAGVRPRCVRPPYGATSTRVRSTLQAMGMSQSLWTIDTTDWSGKSAASIVSSMNSARNGSVILLHDGGGNRSRTVDALRTWLAANHTRFEFRTLPNC